MCKDCSGCCKFVVIHLAKSQTLFSKYQKEIMNSACCIGDGRDKFAIRVLERMHKWMLKAFEEISNGECCEISAHSISCIVESTLRNLEEYISDKCLCYTECDNDDCKLIRIVNQTVCWYEKTLKLLYRTNDCDDNCSNLARMRFEY